MHLDAAFANLPCVQILHCHFVHWDTCSVAKGSFLSTKINLGFSSLLSTPRGAKPVRRPPHVVKSIAARNVCDSCTTSHMQGLLPAPNVASEDDADQSNRAPQPQPVPFGSGVATGMACPAGKTSRPDTCFMTHRYVKQEIAYLARRIDEVGRYFLALESMVGSGALGPVLERCLKDLEECLQEPDKLKDADEVQSFIDAAVRLGLSPARYKPLQNRLSWLNHGRRHQEIQTELATAAPFADDAVGLQQSIDDGVRSGIGAQELQRARQRLDQLKENETNEEMLRAACRGDFTTVELKLRKGADCNWQQKTSGYSLWHIAADTGDLTLANLAKSFNARTTLLDRSGWTSLMVASANHDRRLVRALLDAGADPGATSASVEMVLECHAEEELQSIKANLDVTGRLESYLATPSLPSLDTGDQLLAGEELLLPTFRRVSGRTALHVALLRPGHESGRLAVLKEILSQDVPGIVNAQDDLGQSPLWYAAKGGFIGCARSLLRAGAFVSLGSMSSLQAAMRFLSATGSTRLTSRGEDIFRLLLRNGGSDCAEQVRDAETFLDTDLAVCEKPSSLEDALASLGAAEAIEEGFLDYSTQLEEEYERRLLIQRPLFGMSLTSAEEAADFAKGALEELTALAYTVAHPAGGYVELGPEPSAIRMSRLYRQQQEHGLVFDDWAAVVGGCEATLIFPKLEDVYQALADLEKAKSCSIRGVKDSLLSGLSTFFREDDLEDLPPEDAARAVAVQGLAAATEVALRNLAEDGSGAESLGALERDNLLRGPLFDIESAVLPDVSVWIDCSGCVCLLRLTTERVHEVVQAELDSGRWALEELARAMHLSLQSPEGTDTEDEILEILDAAKTILGKDYLAQVLAIPLQGSWACTVAGLAAHSGLTSVLKILIDAGAPISQPRLPASCAPRGDYSPLSLAIAGQHWECVSLLIASGADPFESCLDDLTRSLHASQGFQ
ncbi:unnamed protein product, partial [Durusdinium trenchii]